MTKLEAAKSEFELRKERLRAAAIAYTAEAAEFGTKDSDAMAELESASLNFCVAHTAFNNAEAGDELEYIRQQKS